MADDKQEGKAQRTSEPATLRYRFIGSHADSLADGRILEPGEFVELTDEEVREPHTEMHLADGNLIGTDEASEHQATLAVRRKERRSAGDTTQEGDESR